MADARSWAARSTVHGASVENGSARVNPARAAARDRRRGAAAGRAGRVRSTDETSAWAADPAPRRDPGGRNTKPVIFAGKSALAVFFPGQPRQIRGPQLGVARHRKRVAIGETRAFGLGSEKSLPSFRVVFVQLGGCRHAVILREKNNDVRLDVGVGRGQCFSIVEAEIGQIGKGVGDDQRGPRVFQQQRGSKSRDVRTGESPAEKCQMQCAAVVRQSHRLFDDRHRRRRAGRRGGDVVLSRRLEEQGVPFGFDHYPRRVRIELAKRLPYADEQCGADQHGGQRGGRPLAAQLARPPGRSAPRAPAGRRRRS